MILKVAVLVIGTFIMGYMNYAVLSSVRQSIKNGQDDPFKEKMLFMAMCGTGLSIFLTFTGYLPGPSE